MDGVDIKPKPDADNKHLKRVDPALSNEGADDKIHGLDPITLLSPSVVLFGALFTAHLSGYTS